MILQIDSVDPQTSSERISYIENISAFSVDKRPSQKNLEVTFTHTNYTGVNVQKVENVVFVRAERNNGDEIQAWRA
jgi:hypothetical protein